MRRKPEQQLAMLTSLSTEDLIPKDHPIRRIRKIVDEVLGELDGEFQAMYSRIARPGVPPEQLLKATIRCRCTRCVVGSCRPSRHARQQSNTDQQMSFRNR